MKKYKINEFEFELIENVKDGFDLEEVNNKYTDYFDNYDYLVGDWSYGAMRLKGFCDKENKLNNKINNISNKEAYIKNSCAYGCRYFVLKKLTSEN